MYEIEIKTPEGIFKYEKEDVAEIEKIIQDHPDYEEVKAVKE